MRQTARRRRTHPLAGLAVACALLAGATVARGATVAIPASKDNTLYESASGSLSNGRGSYFFVGRVDVINSGVIRRGVIAFNVAAAVPAGSVITRASLTLNMSRTIAGLQPVSLHRLLADWGEGASNATGNEGGGAPAATGDATWIHRSFSTVRWTGPGAAGDFVTTPSTTIQVGGLGSYTFLSTPAMVADVQAWLNDPGRNFGWILIGNETALATTKRFDSKDNIQASVRPVLTVEFSTPAPGAGRVPDGGRAPGTPLTVEPAAFGEVRLSWGASCVSGDIDYEVYAGVMGDFTNYAPLACSTIGATSLTLTPSAGSEFYLVVPRNATREGSYGFDSDGLERPPAPAADACVPQEIAACP